MKVPLRSLRRMGETQWKVRRREIETEREEPGERGFSSEGEQKNTVTLLSSFDVCYDPCPFMNVFLSVRGDLQLICD